MDGLNQSASFEHDICGRSQGCAELHGVPDRQGLIARVAAEHNRQTDTVADLRTRLGKPLTTNQIYDIRIEDIPIYRERGVIVIDASYEKRSPLFWILDGVIVFDDLVAETASMSRT